MNNNESEKKKKKKKSPKRTIARSVSAQWSIVIARVNLEAIMRFDYAECVRKGLFDGKVRNFRFISNSFAGGQSFYTDIKKC